MSESPGSTGSARPSKEPSLPASLPSLPASLPSLPGSLPSLPASLRDPGLAPLWDALRDRLERRGAAPHGKLRVPALSVGARHVLVSLLGRPLGATIDLAALGGALARVGATGGLADTLAALGHPVSPLPEKRREERRERAAVRELVRARAAGWSEDWGAWWADDVVRAGIVAGLGIEAAGVLIDGVRRCLDAVDPSRTSSRVELAATVLGDAHALDPGTRLGAAVTRALGHRFAADLDHEVDRSVWERAGAPGDSVSAPVLTWSLPVLDSSPLSAVVSGATRLGVVAHLSSMALRRYPVRVEEGTVVLVCENPRVVEAAAQRGCAAAVVSTNGNPAHAPRLLVEQLVACGAVVRYHGDFDAPGLAICRRMTALGARPWRMDAANYERAVSAAEAAGVLLPVDDADPGPTPWDPPLADSFRRLARIVHEERLLDELLTPE